MQCDCGRLLQNLTANPRPMRCLCGAVHEVEASGSPVHHSCGEPEPVTEITPTWVHAIRRLRKPGDTGVGDTVARLLGRFGERFKAWSAKLGIPCGCTARQAEWNRRWPYAPK